MGTSLLDYLMDEGRVLDVEMTNRERFLAVLDGKSPDRIPWMPRVRLWYNARQTEGTMPARFKGMTEQEVGKAIGIGDPARDGFIFRTRHEGMDVRVQYEPGLVRTTYITPFGTVAYGQTTTAYLEGRSVSGLATEHPIMTAADFRVWEYVTEHTWYEPAYEEYLAYENMIGDEGYPTVKVGDCPFHYFLLHLCGYNDAFYLMADHPEELNHLMAVMTQVERERLWPIIAESLARSIMHGEHFDSQMTPPHLFRKYIMPYYKELSALLHSKGKKLSWHADDDAQAILQEIKESGFDMSECFCTAPMVRVTLEEARQAWGNEVIIWGGIPSIVLEDTFPQDAFEAYVKDVLRTIAPGDAMILGVSDNMMPRSIIERVELISDMVEQYGKYPINPREIG